MKKAEYKIVSAVEGIAALEAKITKMLNAGWKLQGGIAFSAGCPFQAMARVVTVKPAQEGNKETAGAKPEATKLLGAQDAMRAIDELT